MFNYGTKQLFKYFIDIKKPSKINLNLSFDIPYYSDSIRIEKHIYLMGGSGSKFSGPFLSCLLRFRADNPEFSCNERASMIKGKQTVSPCASPKGIIYVIGGWNGNYLQDVEKYIPFTNTWSSLCPLSEGRCAIATCVFKDEYLYAIGGYSSPSCFERLNLNDGTNFESFKFSYADTKIMYMRVTQIDDNVMLVFGEGVSKLISINENEHIIKEGNALLNNNKIWCYSNCFTYGSNVYSLDKVGNIHIYYMTSNSWDIITFDTWKPH